MRRNGEGCSPHPALCGLRTRRLTRWARSVSVVSGVSEAVLKTHEHLFTGARLEVLRNPMAAYNGEILRTPSSQTPTIGYIGGLSREKGVDALLDAVEQLHAEPFRFRLAGRGRLAGLVSKRAERLPNLEFDGISFLQGAITITDDGGVMDENVWAVIAPDEAVSLGVVKPLHRSLHFAGPPDRDFGIWDPAAGESA